MKTQKVKNLIVFVIMVLVALICLLPFYFMIIMSTQYTENIYKGITFLPGSYLIENLKTVFNAHFEMYYKNSIIVAVSATALSLFVSTLCGFSFAMYDFKGARFLFAFVLVTMMIPTQLGLVAFVVEMKNIGWMNTLLPLIVLNKSDTYTVPIGIINLNSAYRNDLAAKITALSIGIIPLLVLFMLTAKTFISGITMGAVKE